MSNRLWFWGTLKDMAGGESHKRHICHIGNEKFKKHTTIPTTRRFFREIERKSNPLFIRLKSGIFLIG